MENMEHPLGASEARAAIADAEAARARLASGLRLPSFFYSSIAVAVTVQIASGAVGIAAQTAGGMALLAGGLLLAGLVAAVQLARFRRLNGAWVGGLASQVLLGTTGQASLAHTAAFGLATWLAFTETRWLVPVVAAAGGAAYAWAGRRWWRRYQGAPAEHSRGENLVVLTVAVVLALVFLIVLVAER